MSQISNRMNSDFGKKLVELRKAKGLTQDEIAERCKLTTRTIQRIELGVVTPRAFTIRTISDALGVDFFETSNTGYEANIKGQYSKLKWNINNLFNLKKNTMKKVSVLAAFGLVAGIALFVLVSRVNAQPPQSQNLPNYIVTEDKIEVAFTYALTFDSLVYIKDDLAKRGFQLNFKRLEFDSTNHLIDIECYIMSKERGGGGIGIGMLNGENRDRRTGFRYDFSKNAETSFLAGELSPKKPKNN